LLDTALTSAPAESKTSTAAPASPQP
jgi:hypothetical protein